MEFKIGESVEFDWGENRNWPAKIKKIQGGEAIVESGTFIFTVKLADLRRPDTSYQWKLTNELRWFNGVLQYKWINYVTQEEGWTDVPIV